jgi:hypothetical protein
MLSLVDGKEIIKSTQPPVMTGLQPQCIVHPGTHALCPSLGDCLLGYRHQFRINRRREPFLAAHKNMLQLCHDRSIHSGWTVTSRFIIGLHIILATRVIRWDDSDVDYVLAQVNIGRLRAPLDAPALADFVAALDPVNAAADTAPGFLWRLQAEDGNATAVQAFEWDAAGSAGVIVNMSVWETVEALAAYVYSDRHRQVLRRRREWFEPMTEAYSAMWWIRRGMVPTTAEAEARVRYLRAHGPTPHAFTLRRHFPMPGEPDREPCAGRDDWMCPA